MEILQELLYNSYLVSNLFLTKETATEPLVTPGSKNTVKIGTQPAEEEEGEEPSHAFQQLNQPEVT